MIRVTVTTARHLLVTAVIAVVLATADAVAAQESDGGAVVPSEPSERTLGGSYVVAAIVVGAVVALFVAQAVRNRRADDAADSAP